jgi:plastocyanin
MHPIVGETSQINPSGVDSVIIGKLRSPSSTHYLSSQATTSLTSTPIANAEIFGSRYMDGHSVVQMSAINGALLFSNNAAKFSSDKTNAKKMLGSVRKIADNKLLLADSIRKRAIISQTNLVTQDTFVAWEYLSPRNIVDAQPLMIGEKSVIVNETTANPASLIVTQGTTVIWTNNSLSNVTIYSGYTIAVQFNEDPDLTLYGDDFKSQELQPGEQFSFNFKNLGTFYWFAYPSIVSGAIYVSSGASDDKYYLVENDMSNSAFGSRVIKVNSFGKILWEFGSGHIVNPKDIRVSSNESSIIIST